MTTVEAPPEPAGIETDLEGAALLTNPLLNKGTAFTDDERTTFALHGLLPPHVGTLDDQLTRRLQALRKFDRDLDRYVFLRGLQDANETLFYALLTRNLAEMLPLVYTPTVGQGCEEFSNYWHYPRGLFLSWPHRAHIADILAHPRFDNDRGDRRQRRRAHIGTRRSGRRRHGHPDRQALALHCLRRPPPGDDPAHPARHRHRQSRAARRSRLYRMAARAGARHRLRRVHRAIRHGRGKALAAYACCNGRILPAPMPAASSSAIASASAPSTTTSRVLRPWPPAHCSPRHASPERHCGIKPSCCLAREPRAAASAICS